MNILVTDGDNRAALAITRSLGKKGHTVIVGNHKHPTLASSSKYCKSRVIYPNPNDSPDAFIAQLTEIITRNKIDVILPVSDVTTIPVCDNKEKLEQYCKVPFSSSQSVNLAANKGQLFRLAVDLGVAIPRSFWLEHGADPSSFLQKLSFPIVVKPSKSRIRTKNSWISTAVSYAYDREEFKRIINAAPLLSYPLLLQERITGPGVGVFVCYDRGKPLVFFSHRRIREKPPSGGVSVLRESIPVSPIAQDYSERLLSRLNWHGVAMVEFKVDERDNIPKLMEINGRFWGSLQLAIDAGVDFPALLIETVEKNHVPPLGNYAIGVRTRWLMGDIDSLLMVLLRDRRKLSLPIGHQGRLQYLLEFLKLWQKNTYYEVLKREDIRPWIYELKQWCCGKN